MNKHTPGPWKFVPSNKTGVIMGGYSPVMLREFCVGAVWPGLPGGQDESTANGRLIATAPRLLACAQKVIEREAVGDLAGAIRELSDAVMEATSS